MPGRGRSSGAGPRRARRRSTEISTTCYVEGAQPVSCRQSPSEACAIGEYAGTPARASPGGLSGHDVLVVHVRGRSRTTVLGALPKPAPARCCARGRAGERGSSPRPAARGVRRRRRPPAENAEAVAELTLGFARDAQPRAASHRRSATLLVAANGGLGELRVRGGRGSSASSSRRPARSGWSASGRWGRGVARGGGLRFGMTAARATTPGLIRPSQFDGPGVERDRGRGRSCSPGRTSSRCTRGRLAENREPAGRRAQFAADAAGAPIFVNTARETLVDEAALPRRRSERGAALGGAALDVVRPITVRGGRTPAAVRSSPVVVAAAHRRRHRRDARARAPQMVADEIRRFAAGQPTGARGRPRGPPMSDRLTSRARSTRGPAVRSRAVVFDERGPHRSVLGHSASGRTAAAPGVPGSAGVRHRSANWSARSAPARARARSASGGCGRRPRRGGGQRRACARAWCSSARTPAGASVLLKGGWTLSMVDGYIVGFRSPQSYFALQDPDQTPRFFGRVRMSRNEAVEMARYTILKLGISLDSVFAEQEPRVTGPPPVGGTNIVPRYRVEWTNPRIGNDIADTSPQGAGHNDVDIEVNADAKRVEWLRFGLQGEPPKSSQEFDNDWCCSTEISIP